MKKILFSLTVLIGLNAYSQVIPEPVHSFLRPDDKIFEVFYGGPNFFKDTPFSRYTNQITPGSGIGHLGFRFENMISTKFSVGLESAFVQGDYSYTQTFFNNYYDPNTGTYVYSDSTVTQTRSVTRAGVVAMFTLHKSAFKNFDYYFAGGAGYQYKKITGTTQREYVFPITFRLGLGFRYYPTPNFSLGMNAGLGQGGLLNVGAGFKF